MIIPFTVYVGIESSDAPEEFRTDFLHDLKFRLHRLAGVEVLDFMRLEDGTGIDASRYGKKCTQEADLVIFILDYPSIDVGKKIVYREITGKPDLYFLKRHKNVTRMVLSELKGAGKPLHRYGHVQEIVEIVWAHIHNARPDLANVAMGPP